MASKTREKFSKDRYDAVVVGSGPNGLTAAILSAQKGLSVVVVEEQDTIGGGARSAQLTLPGYTHDLCSSVHPLGFGSPIFRTFPLDRHGLEWIQPAAPYAHPFDSGRAVVVYRSIEQTAQQLGTDGARYMKLMERLVPPDWDELCEIMRSPASLATHPLALARFGAKAMLPATVFVRAHFRDIYAPAIFAGVAAHSSLRLDALASASFGLVLGLAAHAVGWPFPRGGTQRLTDALEAYLQSLGGEVITGAPVRSFADLPERELLFLDLTPRQLLRILGNELPSLYSKELANYKYGPASFKLDWALDGPIPWTATHCSEAATVHLGGTFDEIELSESGNWNGEHAKRPYILVAQTSLFDESRAPQGKQTGWAYCHVPNGSTFDMTERIENQIERFAPGFRNKILARSVMTPALMQKKNANYVGGDINGGSLTLNQLFTRPTLRLIPYKVPIPGTFICSSASPPGSGVHGMCGYYAFHAAMLNLKRRMGFIRPEMLTN